MSQQGDRRTSNLTCTSNDPPHYPQHASQQPHASQQQQPPPPPPPPSQQQQQASQPRRPAARQQQQQQQRTFHRAHSWGSFGGRGGSGLGASTIMVVHQHDVLSGRGVNIAQHPGNERFRALVNSRADEGYCAEYTTTEKRAVASEIIAHIRNLNPPGRFLKRTRSSSSSRSTSYWRGAGGSMSQRGLEGPWEELTPEEVLKKTCQALRDCNRQDRTGYASAVAMPVDVQQHLHWRTRTGLTNRQQAQQAAAKVQQHQQQIFQSNAVPVTASGANVAAMPAPSSETTFAETLARATTTSSTALVPQAPLSSSARALSPSIKNASQWLKQQHNRTDLQICTDFSFINHPQSHTTKDDETPTTAATTGRSALSAPFHYPNEDSMMAITSSSFCDRTTSFDDDSSPTSLSYATAATQHQEHHHGQMMMQMTPPSPGPVPAFSYSPLDPNEESDGATNAAMAAAAAAAVSSFHVPMPSLLLEDAPLGFTASMTATTATANTMAAIGSGPGEDSTAAPGRDSNLNRGDFQNSLSLLEVSGFPSTSFPHAAAEQLQHSDLYRDDYCLEGQLHLSAVATSAAASTNSQQLNRREEHHDDLLDHHNQQHHLHLDPLDQEPLDGESDLRYSPGPASPFRDGDFTTEEEEDRPPPFPGDD